MSTILVIEDSKGQRTEIRGALEASGICERVLEASDGIEGLKLLLSESADLVLCDLEMPGLDGEKILRMARSERKAEVAAPFLFLTAVTDPERRARLLEDGAADAITKPFHAADLIARVRLHLELVRAQRELIEKNRELALLSTTDSLTGLCNRRQVESILQLEWARSRRTQERFSVAMIDIDHFKDVNDEYGHPGGDRVLVSLAGILAGRVRESDGVGRVGGEEFLAVLGQNDAAGATVFAESVRAAVEDMKVECEDGRSVSVTVSVGVASGSGRLESPTPVIAQADRALYQAKRSGRNRVCAYSPESGD